MKKINLKPSRFKTKRTARGTIKISRRNWLILPLTILLLGGLLYVYMAHARAASISTSPISDIQTGWKTSTGTTHYSLVDDGTSPVTTDYVNTGTGGTASVTDEYGLSTVANVASASQLVLNVYAEAATVGSTADTLNINLKVSGTLQTQATCTPGSGGAGIWAWCTATFTGSWTQTNVNAMSVVISNTINGSGSGSTREDDIRVADIYGTLTYVSSMTETQASYRVFNNTDTSGQTTFAKTWGGSLNSEVGYSMVQTSDGGYAVTGYTQSFGAGGQDMFIAKYTSSGTLSWSKTWGGTNTDIGNSIVQTSDGGYAVTGQTSSFGDTTNGDMFIAKYTSTGSLSWSKTWGGTSVDKGNSIVQTSDGGYAVTGSTVSFGGGGTSMFIAKYSSTGSLSWSKTWGGPNTTSSSGNSITKTSDGGYAVTGSTDIPSGGSGTSQMFIAKYTSTGTLSWSKTWGGTTGNSSGSSIAQTSDGGYAVTGQTYITDATNGDMFIAKYTSTGTLSWSKTWGGTGVDQGKSIVQTSDGGYAIAGNTNSFGAGNYDMFISKYTSTGTLSWSKTWGGTSDDQGTSIAQTSDGGYAVAGYTLSFGASTSNYDAFIAKYNSSGNITGCASTVCKADTIGGGSDYTSTNKADTIGGGSDYTSTMTLVSAVVSPTVDVGTPLAAQNTAAAITGDSTAFRLRMDVRLTGATLAAGAGSFKLQYALRGTDNSCDTSFTGETYADVTDTSTVRYYDNPVASSGLSLTTNANDPTDGSNTPVYESYQEKGTTTFTNLTAIPGNSYGVWDFALSTYQTLAGQHYCMRIVKSGANLDAYVTGAIAEISLPSAPTYNQAAYGWYTNTNATSVGAALTGVNKSYDLPALGTPIRLRALIGVSNTGLTASGQSFKLQYAPRVTSCAAATYNDVSTTTPIQWYDNSTPASGAAVTAGGSDPTDGSNTIVAQTYQEANNLTNTTVLYSSQDGLWDFSLVMPAGTLPGTDICLRIVTSAGAILNSYGNYPEVQYGPTMSQHLHQGKYFDANGAQQPYFLGGKQ